MVCIQRTPNGGLGMHDLVKGRPCRGTWCGDERQVGFVPASSQIPRLKLDVSRGAKHRLSVNAVQPFVTFLGPVTLHCLEKNYIGN